MEDPDARQVVAAAEEVHREFGPGFLEIAYARALEIELGSRGVPFEPEAPIPLRYKGMNLGVPFRADFVCHGDLIVELKAVHLMGHLERAQVRNYLRCSGFGRAL